MPLPDDSRTRFLGLPPLSPAHDNIRRINCDAPASTTNGAGGGNADADASGTCNRVTLLLLYPKDVLVI